MRRFLIFLLSLIAFLCCSCSSWKDFCYLQDIGDFEDMAVKTETEVRVRRGDCLNIYVSSRNPESSRPFNLTVVGNTTSDLESSRNLSNGSTKLLSYKVDQFGCIEFPQLGVINCEGMTRTELSTYVKDQLIENGFLKDPIVTVEFQNLIVTVIGEVNRPGSYQMNNDHATLLEALGQAGDLTAYGRRDRVSVIREVDGRRTIVNHDLRSKELFNSPRYYLQQNDIVYVQPNRAKATQSDVSRWSQPSVWFSLVSTVMSLSTFIISFSR